MTQVNIQFSVDVEKIPHEIERITTEATRKLKTTTDAANQLSSLLIGKEADFAVAMATLATLRTSLSKIDLGFENAMSIIQDYVQLIGPQKAITLNKDVEKGLSEQSSSSSLPETG